ncbi:hypothetical protein [Rhodanobacter sp. L36]|uniref:hypothetical protein n=1 Tax=Rhodanobacter sp. L36 TaxID=1747221 RepID=UPI00131D9A33|nr:hypothetical protein [Rhodanobacter sp. L36]
MKTGFNVVVLTCLLAVSSRAAATDCAAIERHVRAVAQTLPYVADQTGAIQALGQSAANALHDCSDSAPLWYTAARAAEVLDAAQQPAELRALGDPKQIARDGASHAPRSAPIATVLARLDASMASARHAYDLDPNYRPAQRALALALAKSGAIDQAQRLLPDHPSTGADRIAIARILLIAGHASDAAAEAKKALDASTMDTDEWAPGEELLRDGNEVHGFALLAEGKPREADRALHIAAIHGSQAARTHRDEMCAAATPSQRRDDSCPIP